MPPLRCTDFDMSEKKVTSITRRYIINGKEYHSLADIPESERKKFGADIDRLFEDKDNDGVPDILQGEEDVPSSVRARAVFESTVQRQDERWRERAGYYIVILALLAVIVFLLLRQP
jgi:hypothetical protein